MQTINALTPEEQRTGTALLIIRLAAAAAFLYHGSAILFGAFGGPGVEGFAGATHLPIAVAFLVGLAQFCGGLAMLTGLLARLGAAGIVAVMLGAIFLVHLPKGFDVTKGGMEYALTQLLIAVAVLIAGAGPYSLYTLFARQRPVDTAAGRHVAAGHS
ncbi:MAG TPA: DoxX family protein [Chthonomonadaceae bacterium]|nr:DoxX family protein [Chthonomonadaceae bacterium]